mgnify:CR=1 FL=1
MKKLMFALAIASISSATFAQQSNKSQNAIVSESVDVMEVPVDKYKVETNRFARADLEYKLLLVDDDMKTEALPQTNNIKTLVTLEDKIDIERKGQQSVQGTLYVRFACFGNGSLHALYDKSNGFYRRQLLLTTKEKPVGRVDDPFLIDKMRNEK